ncbi:MAG: hypothetical protein PHD01_17325 [Geobacteraceae bacterium]|nr:hypothetical protein [Geobacteraceae bacterium]
MHTISTVLRGNARQGQYPLVTHWSHPGGDSFVEKILVESEDISAQRIDIDGIASAVCRFYGAHDEELRGRSHRSSRLRAKAAGIALETEGCTLTELAEVTGRDITTLSCAVRKLHARAGKDSGLADEYRMIKGNLREPARS